MTNYANVPMPLDEASAAVVQYHLRGGTARAVRLFLSGICKTQAEAADQCGVDRSILSRALRRMTSVRTCSCCGQAVRQVEVNSCD